VTREQFQSLRDLTLKALLLADELGASNVALWLDAALVELTGQGVPPPGASALLGEQN